MLTPQVRFKGMEPSDAVQAAVEKNLKRLGRICDCIMSCRVSIEEPHRHRRKGEIFNVRIDLTVPGKEIVVDRNPGQRHSREDVYVALRDAFEAVHRKIEHYMEERRGAVKTHEPPLHGRIVRLVPEKDCGFIETGDGREVYFHRNSVLDARFDGLERGMEVRYTEEMGVAGPQASTVHLVGRHHPVG